MAISLVQSATATSSSSTVTTLTATFASNVTAGNYVVAVLFTYNQAVSTVKLGTSADNFASLISANNSGTDYTTIFGDPNSAGGSNSVTFTVATADYLCMAVYEFSGVATASALDKSSSSTGFSTSPTSGTTVTTSQAVEAWVGAVNIKFTSGFNITGPSSPWTNTSALNSGYTGPGNFGVSAMAGYQVTSLTGTATYAASYPSNANWSGAVVTLLPQLNTTSTGAMTLKPSMSATATGGNTTTTGAMTLRPPMQATDIETFTATGAMTFNPSMSGTGVTANPFPAQVLGLKIELLLNGTWTDITSYAYQRSVISVTYGRPNETQNIQAASMSMILDNRTGRFTPKNSSGAYYPYLVRNTQIRVSITSASASGKIYSGYRFWGQVPTWPPQWDESGKDVTASISASGIVQQLNQDKGTIGSAVRRYVTRLTGSSAPLAYWPCEDVSGSTVLASVISGVSAMTWTGTPSLASDTAFGGSDAIPQLNGSAWTGVAGAYADNGAATYSTPGTYTFDAPGGVTSVTAKVVGGGQGGGGGGYSAGAYWTGSGGAGGEFAEDTAVAVTAGNSYTVVVGSGGAGNSGGDTGLGGSGGDSSFAGDSTTVVAHGAAKVNGYNGGTGSTAPVHHDGGAGDPTVGGWSPSQLPQSGEGGASSGGSASAGNAAGSNGHTGAVAVTDGGPGGNGTDTDGATPAQPGGGGGGGGQVSTSTGNTSGGNGAAGQVKLSWSVPGSGTAPYANSFRFLLDIPLAGGVSGAIYGRITTAGTVAKCDVVYGTGGTLQVIGYDVSGTALFTSTAAGSYNGVPVIVSVELTPSGSNVAWALKTIPPGQSQTATTVASGTVTTASIGGVNDAYANPGGTETGAVGVGHIIVQGVVTSLPDLAYAASGYDGEYAADRFTRLCTEQGVAYTLAGNNTDTPQMGAQQDAKFMDVLQTVEDIDRGQLFERRDAFGLGYRTRVDMQNQAAAVTLDYSSQQISNPFSPAYDEQFIRNLIVLSRQGGSSVTTEDTTSSVSTQDPPNGVGEYSYALTVEGHADSQLANEAAWLLAVGTVDEFRFPSVPLNLTRPALENLFAEIPDMGVGDRFDITNLPAWMPSGTAKQLALGFTETLNAFAWTISPNAVPESPYETALNPNIIAFTSSISTWTAGGGGGSVASATPPAGAPYAYALAFTSDASGVGNAYEDGSPGTASVSTSYRISGWFYSPSTNVQIIWNWLNSGTYVSNTTQNVTVTANTWVYISEAQTSPSSGINQIAPGFAVGGEVSAYTVYGQHVVATPASDWW